MLWKGAKEQGYADSHQPLTLRTDRGIRVATFAADVVEPLRYMLARLASDHGIPRRFGLVAAMRQEGVSYISRALGTIMANDLMEPVCIVELNWWWPAPLPIELPERGGLGAVLQGKIEVDQALIATGQEQLHILPAGDVPLIQRPVLARGAALRKVIDQLANRFSYLILDVPAIRASSDAITLAALADTSCMVIRHGLTSTDRLKLALDDIRHLELVGSVLNHAQLETPDWLFKYVPQE